MKYLGGRKRKYESLDVRFEASYIKSDECWLWNGPMNGTGYGHMEVSRAKWVTAHRFSYEKFIGKIPEGLFVCHKCDVRNCVNPSHLFLGTAADNNLDKETKGRAIVLRGSAHGVSKLTEAQVKEIKAAPRKHGICAELGRIYNISRQNISYIRSNKAWSHVS